MLKPKPLIAPPSRAPWFSSKELPPVRVRPVRTTLPPLPPTEPASMIRELSDKRFSPAVEASTSVMSPNRVISLPLASPVIVTLPAPSISSDEETIRAPSVRRFNPWPDSANLTTSTPAFSFANVTASRRDVTPSKASTTSSVVVTTSDFSSGSGFGLGSGPADTPPNSTAPRSRGPNSGPVFTPAKTEAANPRASMLGASVPAASSAGFVTSECSATV